MAPTLDGLQVADAPAAWRACGFEVDGEECVLGEVRVRLLGDEAGGSGLLGATLRGIDPAAELDGLEIAAADQPGPSAASPHPNGVTGIDHVVAISPDLDRTVAALEAAGLDLRRVRDEPTPAGAPRQAFFRLGEVILECIQLPDSPELDRTRNARLWGLAVRTGDMDATAAFLGERLGGPRPAV